jgi:NAD(P)-dependent dehydrogenase (short-subunit alcohol dehydrogenase family)
MSAPAPPDPPAPRAPAAPLDGRHALVTGAGGGIGAAVARRLAALGARVSLVGRTAAPLEALAAELARQHGRPFAAAPADVTDAAALDGAFAAARAALGPVAVLVNNAGAADSTPFLRLEEDRWAALLDVNLTSAYRCARRALPDMLAGGWGRVVNVASVAGLTGIPYVSAYVAAKHGLVGLTRSLAVEFAKKGVTVNAVCPGYVDTPLVAQSVASLREKTGKSEEELRAAFIRHNPVGRMLTPEEVAGAVAWLCHPEQAMVNGHALVLSGGEVF